MESEGPKHWVGCLFTSQRYGRGKDKPKVIPEATKPAMEQLLQQMGEAEGDIGEVRICQINSGLFSVPWEGPLAVIRNLEVGELDMAGSQSRPWRLKRRHHQCFTTFQGCT
jgi:ADP-ribose 1''-phosphate phosphatase